MNFFGWDSKLVKVSGHDRKLFVKGPDEYLMFWGGKYFHAERINTFKGQIKNGLIRMIGYKE